MKLVPSVVFLSLVALSADAQWSQIGANPKHTGSVPVSAQPLLHLLSDITYDPFIAKEQASANGNLLVHYQVPLVDGDDVFIEFGQFTSPDHWETRSGASARTAACTRRMRDTYSLWADRDRGTGR